MKTNDINYYKCLISKTTDPIKLATSLTMSLQNHDYVELIGIGEKATYIMVKAVTIARGFLNQNEMPDLQVIPEFRVVKDKEGRDITSFVFKTSLVK